MDITADFSPDQIECRATMRQVLFKNKKINFLLWLPGTIYPGLE